MSLRRQALSGLTWTGGATLVCALLQVLQIAVLARLLQAEDFGLMALVMIVIGFMQAYSDMGISGAIVQRQDATIEQLSSLFWLNVLVGITVFGLILIGAPLMAHLYGEPKLDTLVSYAGLLFLIAPAGQLWRMLMQKGLRFGVLAMADVVASAAGAAVAITLAWGGQGVYALIWGQLASTTASTLILVMIGLRIWRPKLRLRRTDLAGYVRFGAYQMGERTINFLGTNLDKLLVGSLVGTQGLGLYNVAFQLVMKPMQLINPIVMRVAFPLFAIVQADNDRLRSGYLDVIRIVSLIMFPIYAGMIVLAEPLVLVLLGENWASLVPTFRWLCVLGFFYSLGNPIGSLLLAKGRVELGLYLNVLMIVLYSIAIWAGASGGTAGVAAGLVIATAFGLFPVGFWMRWVLVRMRPLDYTAAFTPMLVCSGAMGAGLLLAHEFMPGSIGRVVELVTLTLLGCVIYFLTIAFWQWPFFVRLKQTFR